MKENTEFEIGFFIKDTDLEKIRTSITNEGFKFKEKFVQTDRIFDTDNAELFKNKQKIRIRTEKNKIELTYKGIPINGFEKSKRTEINVKIDKNEINNLETFLTVLGYPFCFQIIKERQIYIFKDIIITLDKYPILGWRIEIEGEEKKTKDIYEKMFCNIEKDFSRLSDCFKKKMKDENKDILELKKDYLKKMGTDLGKIELIIY